MKKKRQAIRYSSELPQILAILAFSFLVYSNALQGAFVWDDQEQILRNSQIRSLSHIPGALISPVWLPGLEINFYRPAQAITWMLAYQAGGPDPWPYHLLNILFHAAASAFVYLICLELNLDRFASFFAAGLFAVHPVHTEAVSWMAPPDPGCATFFMGSLWAFLRYMRSSKRTWLWLSAFAFLIALLFKEMAMTLPVVIFVLLIFRRKLARFNLRELIVEFVPYTVAGMIYFGLRMQALGVAYSSRQFNRGGALDLVTLELHVLGQYIQYAVLPHALAIYHLIPPRLSNRMGSTIVYTAVVAATVLTAWFARRKMPEVSLWICLFGIMLAPALNLGAISLNFFAERYLYIPSLAISICAAMLVARLEKPARLAVSMSLLTLFGVMTFVRNRDWSSEEKLYAREVEIYPKATTFRLSLGEVSLKQGNDRVAEEHFRRILADLQSSIYVEPADVDYRAYLGLAAVAARAHKYDEATNLLQTAISINPNDPGAYIYLGGVQIEGAGNYEEGLKYLRKAVELGPGNEVAYDYLGSALFNLKRYEEAAQYFEGALRINPTFKDAQTHLEMTRRTAEQNR